MSFYVRNGTIRLEAGTHEGRAALTDLGFRPAAVILWWASRTDPLTTCANLGGIGVVAEGSHGAATAWAADDRIAAGGLRRWECRQPHPFFACSNPDGEPDLVGSVAGAASGFALDVRGRTPVGWDVHYLAIGGPELRSATVERVPLPPTGRAVAKLGFRPDFLFFVPGAGGSSAQSGSSLGVSVGFAAGRRQAACGFEAQVFEGETQTRSSFRSDAVVAVPRLDDSWSYRTLARVEAIDDEGFTLSCDVAPPDGPPVIVLALAGGRYTVGVGAAPRRRRRRTTAVVDFTPTGMLTLTSGLETMPRIRNLGRLSIGGASSDGSLSCASWSIRRGAWPPEPRARSTSDAAVEVLDTTSGRLYARATRVRFGERRLTLQWAIHDRNPRQFAYAVLGPEHHASKRGGGSGSLSRHLRELGLRLRRQ